MRGLWSRIEWVTTGRGAHPVTAFEWIRGRVGSRENPDGMRSLIHAGIGLALFCALLDGLILWRHDWAHWGLLAVSHSAWVFGFILATVLNVGFLETVHGELMVGLGGPNLLTLGRGLLIPTLLYVVLTLDLALAAAAYALIQLTDVIDGWWARSTGQQSKMGIVLDPMVDLLLHLGVLVAMSHAGLLGPTVLVLVIVRSVLLVFGTGTLYFWKGRVWIHPTPLGKGTGFLLSVATTLLLGLTAAFPETLSASGTGSSLAASTVATLRFIITAFLWLAVLHVIMIGVVNLRMPAVAFEARPRRPWRKRHLGREP